MLKDRNFKIVICFKNKVKYIEKKKKSFYNVK